MTPVEQGRFCQQCAKTVVDFTTFNEKQIQQYFQQHRGSVCGRLQTHQLQTQLTPKKHYSTPSRLALFLAIGLSGSSGLVIAQNNEQRLPLYILKPVVQSIDPDAAGSSDSLLADSTYRIIGRVWSEDEATGPIPGATVYLQGTNIGTYADKEGYFELKLIDKPKDSVELTFSFIGFQAVTKPIDFSDKITVDVGKITLVMDTAALGELIIVNNNPIRGLWWKLKGLFTQRY